MFSCSQKMVLWYLILILQLCFNFEVLFVLWCAKYFLFYSISISLCLGPQRKPSVHAGTFQTAVLARLPTNVASASLIKRSELEAASMTKYAPCHLNWTSSPLLVWQASFIPIFVHVRFIFLWTCVLCFCVLHTGSGRRNRDFTTKILIIWLEDFEDHLNLPIGKFLFILKKPSAKT